MKMSMTAAEKLYAFVSRKALSEQDRTYQNIADRVHQELTFTKEMSSFVKESLEVDINFSDIDRRILTRLLREEKNVLRIP